MFSRLFSSRLSVFFIILAALSGLGCIWLSVHTTHRYMAVGATPTSGGIASMVVSLLGALGFSVAGFLNAMIHKVLPSAPDVTDGEVTQFAELSASFAAFLKDRSNRAAQRRFIFALVDAASLIVGVKTSNVNGVITIEYSGFADPVPPATATK